MYILFKKKMQFCVCFLWCFLCYQKMYILFKKKSNFVFVSYGDFFSAKKMSPCYKVHKKIADQPYYKVISYMRRIEHTYIIGHYNPSVRIIDLVSHTTYFCVLFLFTSGGTYSLKSTPNDRFF